MCKPATDISMRNIFNRDAPELNFQVIKKIDKVCLVRCDSMDGIPFFVLKVIKEGLDELAVRYRHITRLKLHHIHKKRKLPLFEPGQLPYINIYQLYISI